MQYVKLGNSGLSVSRLCLGTMNMGSKEWKPWIFDETESEPIVRHAIDNGVNFIDLADFYSTGAGEEVVGNILRRVARRDELVVTTKVGYAMNGDINGQGHSRKHIMEGIDASLRRLQMDYVDIYMLHFFDTGTPVEETMCAMNDIVRSGKARYIGVSTMYTWQLAKILQVCDKHGWVRPINMQLQLNCAYREEEREMIPFCMDQGIGVSVFSPLARGILTNDLTSTRNQTDFFTTGMYSDKICKEIAHSVAKVADARGCSPAQVAQAWVLRKPEVSSMLVGADTQEQFGSALAALEMQLSDEEVYELERNYTPCDVINDYTAGRRIPRECRPAQAPFLD
ncbi:aldo/keto reductase [Halomonas sp. NCCP-2165]|nr:aldo/keto reductase [Halomonas sp. NCCP-2165]GKW47936.1 oxidoreductase [Halomonas sp. NCCP-2165]